MAEAAKVCLAGTFAIILSDARLSSAETARNCLPASFLGSLLQDCLSKEDLSMRPTSTMMGCED